MTTSATARNQPHTSSLSPSPTRRGSLLPVPVERTGASHLGVDVCEYVMHLRIAKRSEVTISKRVELLRRLARFLEPTPLVDATPEQLFQFQATFAHLAPASVNVYSRHLIAFYRWAHERALIDRDPTAHLVVPHVRKGKPHPTPADDLRVIFTCTSGALRTAYVLACFAGLRCGEITRLEGGDVELGGHAPSALVHGKGGKERVVPLLAPVVAELRGLPRRGWLLLLPSGKPYSPNRLSVESHNHLKGLGIASTLHSMRHAFGTDAYRVTHDPLFVRDVLGHESVSSSEIYMATSMTDAHARLAGLATDAATLLRPRHLEIAK